EFSSLYKLNVQSDRYFFAYQNSACFERRIPSQAEVFAVDFCRGRKSDARVSPGFFRRGCRAIHRKHNLARHSTNREVACQKDLAVRVFRRTGRLEQKRRKLFHMEEVLAL